MLVCFDVEVNPKMTQTKSTAVPEYNDPFPHYDYGSGGHMMKENYRLAREELANVSVDGQATSTKDSKV